MTTVMGAARAKSISGTKPHLGFFVLNVCMRLTR